MTQLHPDRSHQISVRRTLRKQLSFLGMAGLVLLTLSVVSVALGLILAAASDAAGVVAVRVVAGVLAMTTGLVLVVLVAVLTRAVMLLLSEQDLPASHRQLENDE